MVWKQTGRPLRAYQIMSVVFGALLNLESSWAFFVSLAFLLAGLLFHTGTIIPWTIGHKDKKTWLHVSIYWYMAGALAGFLAIWLLKGLGRELV